MSGIVPKRVLEDIRFRSDIVDVISQYFDLKRMGSTFKALCPFHKEKTPSFHVNPQRQIYHCFGCGEGGDVFNFIMQHEKVDFMTAVTMLAERCGIELETEEGDGKRTDKAALYELHSKVSELYHKALLERDTAAPARDYLASRELGDEIVKEFRIGYAPKRWDAVTTWARKNGYSTEVMELSGLVVRNTKSTGQGRDHYDRFRNRLMFPIHDEQGRVIGFSGRLLEDEAQQAKYVNSPETPLFHKSRVLYAMDKARRAIVESREVLVCEGQIDVIRCHQVGLNTAVAAQGTAFTEDHVRILRRYADSVVIVFDPDKAGEDAAVRAAQTFLGAGLAVRVAQLPAGTDPDTFIRQEGGEAFRGLLGRAASVIGYQFGILSQREKVDTEVGVMRAARALLETMLSSPNAVQKARLVQEAAQLLRLPASALQDDLRHLERRQQYRSQAAQAATEKEETANRAQRLPEEVALCEHLVRVADEPELARLVEDYLPLDMLSDPACRALAQAAITAVKEGRDIQQVLQEASEPGTDLQSFFAAVCMAPAKMGGREFSPTNAVQDLILFIWRRHLKEERKTLGPDSNERRSQITYDLNGLKNWERGSEIIELELDR